jgi:DinB superfamily
MLHYKRTLKISMSQEELIVRIARNGWDVHIKRMDALLAALSDAQLDEEIAPGRNRGIYLLGHLIAVHDGLFDILGLGERLYPQLDSVYLSSPDKAGLDMLPAATLRKYWSEVNGRLTDRFSAMPASEWFMQHTHMSAEDFKKEPHRNKLSVLLSRTSHLGYHHGQLVLLKK